jgi:hypothetical protein
MLFAMVLVVVGLSHHEKFIIEGHMIIEMVLN